MKRELFWKNPGYKSSKPFAGLAATRYLIVGGGITGLMSAYFLLAEQVPAADIVIVERDVVGRGSTGHSAGMLVPEPENENNLLWGDYVAKFGEKKMQEYRAAHRDALRLIRRIIRIADISCDAEMEDLLIFASDAEGERHLRSDAGARKRLGERARNLRKFYVDKEISSSRYQFAERATPALSVNPLALSQGIATNLRAQGVRIFEHTEYRSAYRGTARFTRGAIDFEKVIFAQGTRAENAGLRNFTTTIAVTEPFTRAQLLKLRLDDHDMFLDEEGSGSYHYCKMTADDRLLIGYGDVRSKDAATDIRLHEPHLRSIASFLSLQFPSVPLKIAYAWSSRYALSKDLAPLIRMKGNEIVVNGAGIQLGCVIAARYAVSKLLGKPHPLESILGR